MHLIEKCQESSRFFASIKETKTNPELYIFLHLLLISSLFSFSKFFFFFFCSLSSAAFREVGPLRCTSQIDLPYFSLFFRKFYFTSSFIFFNVSRELKKSFYVDVSRFAMKARLLRRFPRKPAVTVAPCFGVLLDNLLPFQLLQFTF